MNSLLFEFIAFFISIIAFTFGLFFIYFKKIPVYFKLLVGATGCYALEEFWTIVNALIGFQNDFFSVRLIGIFGCFCTILTANLYGINKVIDYKSNSNKIVNLFSFFAPLGAILAFFFYVFQKINTLSVIHFVISFIVLLPLIIDSYFEFKYLFNNNSNKNIISIKVINLVVILEYIVSLSYLFISSVKLGLILDVVSACLMALLVFVCERSAKKWETLT